MGDNKFLPANSHVSRRLKCTFVIMRCPSVRRRNLWTFSSRHAFFLQHALTYWAETLCRTLFNARKLKQNRSTEGCSKLRRSVDTTSSGKNGLNIRTNASPKMGQDQVSRGVSVLYWLAASIAMFYGNLPNLGNKVKIVNQHQVRMQSISINFYRSYAPFEHYIIENMQFCTLFSNMLRHIVYDFLFMNLRSV